MFIVWSRLGFLGVVVPLVVSVVGTLICDALFGKDQLAANAVFGVCFMLSAPAVWYLGRRLNSQPNRILIDPATNEQVVLVRKHTLFWMKLEYFAVPVMLLGAFWLSNA